MIDESDSIVWKSGSGRARTARHDDNIDAVADLAQSQEDKTVSVVVSISTF